jgi:hypothetical protein
VSVSLLVLCLTAFAMVAIPLSALLAVALPGLDRLVATLPPRHRARLWLGLAALPSVAAALAVGAALLPALGFGHDHCLSHGPHHPHLCPHHLGAAPGIVLVLIALLPSLRLLQSVAALGRGIRLSRDASGTLIPTPKKSKIPRNCVTWVSCTGRFVLCTSRSRKSITLVTLSGH